MLRPTIYIPSRLIRLLALLALPAADSPRLLACQLTRLGPEPLGIAGQKARYGGTYSPRKPDHAVILSEAKDRPG